LFVFIWSNVQNILNLLPAEEKLKTRKASHFHERPFDIVEIEV